MNDGYQSVAAAESVCRVMLRFVTFDREALFQRASDGQVTACCTFNNTELLWWTPAVRRMGAVLCPQPERPIGA